MSQEERIFGQSSNEKGGGPQRRAAYFTPPVLMLTSDGTDRWVNARLHPKACYFILYYVPLALVWMYSSGSVFQVDVFKDTFKMRDLFSNFVAKNTSAKLGGFQG